MTRHNTLRAVRPRALRDAFGRLGTGVAVVTTLDEERVPYGATVTSFAAVSEDPPLVQVTLRRTSKATRVLKSSPFAVNILAADQADVARRFAGDTVIPAPDWSLHGDVPVLEGNASTMECRPWNLYDGGDHVIVVGEVVALAVGDAEPLLSQGSGFRRLGEQLLAVRSAGSPAGSPAGAVAGAPADAPPADPGGWLAGVGSFTRL
ncbi:flavin reductase family protein [Arthrobacter sp. KK5.5]|uniref:flavin reductase family protein n=1 Tax=Arthrobacter sp. KK5.5 TaxID=3373084 RepID=UPI003EE49462